MTSLRYHLKTYGCQMNYSDSERVSAVLENIGFQPAQSENEADLIIFNTCSIRQKAEDRVLGLMPQMEALKGKNRNLMVAITGCMVQISSTKRSPSRLQDDFLRKLDAVDLVFRIDELAKLPFLMKEANPDIELQNIGSELDDGTLRNYFQINPRYTSKFQAFVPIMTGCDKFCAFCIVPYTRGRERSRSIEEVYRECEKLVENGCVEITLLGQNVNSYGLSAIDRRSGNFQYDDHGNGTWPWKIQGRSPFATLLHKIDSLYEKGLRRVRWTSPHPRDMTDDVIEAVATLKTQMPYIHLPVQAGNDEVLRRMNRPYTVERYREIIRKIRLAIPDCAISTDIIVGFCGETEEQFEDTCRLFEEIQWDMAYIAQYSMRRFTLAHRTMKDDVPPKEKARRWHRLNEILTKASREKHERFIWKTVELLVEKCEKNDQGERICEGRSEHFKRTQFPGTPDLVGKFVPVKITEAFDWNLRGVLTK